MFGWGARPGDGIDVQVQDVAAAQADAPGKCDSSAMPSAAPFRAPGKPTKRAERHAPKRAVSYCRGPKIRTVSGVQWPVERAARLRADGLANESRGEGEQSGGDTLTDRGARSHSVRGSPVDAHPRLRRGSGLAAATAVIEGAWGHLVKDRVDITGARWSLAGAEAFPELRSLISNGDSDTYWEPLRDRRDAVTPASECCINSMLLSGPRAATTRGRGP